MDIKSVVAEAMREAAAPAEPVAPPVAPADKKSEAFADYVQKMIAEKPGDVITVTEQYGESTILPGFETLSMGLAQVYGLKWGALGAFHVWKSKAYQPHIVPTAVGTHIVRGFSRREWMTLQKKILEHTRDRITKHTEEASDVKWAETEIQAHTEEMIVVAGACDPEYTMETIRAIPTGIVSHLANCIMMASGHEAQPLPPLALK